MAKQILYGKEAREKILSGVKQLADTVAVTMGPQGKQVLLGASLNIGAPISTKDGVTVARNITLADPVEDMGAQIVKEAAGRTADVAGDGTTTATVLTHAIFSGGCALMNEGYRPLDLKSGIELAVHDICNLLDIQSSKIVKQEEVVNIASISANNDRLLGEKIAEAFERVSWTGTVTLEAIPGMETTVRSTDGLEIKSGYVVPEFVTEKGTSECVLDNPAILIYDGELTHISNCLSLLNEAHVSNKALLILARSTKQEALATILGNKKLGKLNAVAVDIPRFGFVQKDWLNDLAVMLDTRVVSDDISDPLSKITMADLGSARRVIVDRTSTKIIDVAGKKDVIQDRIDKCNAQLARTPGDTDRKELKNRIAFMNSKAAVISVGYSTELELREKGDRLDDALSATRAALEEGILPGGGYALFYASTIAESLLEKVPAHLQGAYSVVIDACLMPLKQICINAGRDPSEVLIKIEREMTDGTMQAYGYNAANDSFGDMYEMGIIDPKKVTRAALQNAASIALQLINTEALVVEMPDRPSDWQPPPGWRPPSNSNLNHKR